MTLLYGILIGSLLSGITLSLFVKLVIASIRAVFLGRARSPQ